MLLVKPQFEVGRARVGKGGVVRDPAAHEDAIDGVIAAAAGLGLSAAGLVASPITGPAGNHEYLLWLKPGDPLATARGKGAEAAGPSHASTSTAITSDARTSPASTSPGPAIHLCPSDGLPIDPAEIRRLVQETRAGG